MAHRDERILCVDAAWSCPTLNSLLNVPEPRFDFEGDSILPLGAEGSHIADFIETTGVDGVWIASLAAGRDFPFARPRLEPFELIEQLHALDFDWVFLDLAPGIDPLDVGLFTLSDIPMLIAAPEPAAVRVATQYLRNAMVEAVRAHPDATACEEALRTILDRQPLEVSTRTLREAAPDAAVAEIIDDALERLECYLVVNLVREGAEQDLGFVICHAWYEALSVFPRFLTSVDYENRRWFYHRRTTGENAVRGDETLSRDIESLSDMASDISVVDAKYPRPIPSEPEEDLHPALRLGISPDSSRNEVRQHCRRLWEGYKRERAVDVIFSDSESRTDIAGELESLYRKVLTLPSDTFDTVRDLDQPPNADVGLSAESSSDPAQSAANSSEMVLREESSSPRIESGDTSGAARSPAGGRAGPEEPADGDDAPTRGTDAELPSSDGAASTTSESPAEEDDSEGETGGTEPERDGELPAIGPPDATEPGLLVERLRRRNSVSLQELSRRTNIGVKYLTALEDADIDALPRPVYLREYLRKVARVFDVSGDALVEAYLERLDRTI